MPVSFNKAGCLAKVLVLCSNDGNSVSFQSFRSFGSAYQDSKVSFLHFKYGLYLAYCNNCFMKSCFVYVTEETNIRSVLHLMKSFSIFQLDWSDFFFSNNSSFGNSSDNNIYFLNLY